MRNIYLTGMMGSGKSAVARVLSKEMKKDLVDLDLQIEKRVKLTIPEIFKQHGQTFFRLQEGICLQEILKKEDLVVATGGGIVMNPQNITWMKRSGIIVYLSADVEVLWGRVKGKTNRPLLAQGSSQEKMELLFLDRKKSYEMSCDFSVSTNSGDVEKIACEIQEKLKEIA